MKKQLLVAAIIAMVAGNAWALVADRTVHNQSSHVIFVAWKNTTKNPLTGTPYHSKSTYQRIFPGESETFGFTARGYGLKGIYGNIIQVEIGGNIGKGGKESYREKANATNKSMAKWKEAFVRDVKGNPNAIEVVLSGELFGKDADKE